MECYNYLLLQNEECGCGGIEAPRKILIDRPKIILGKGSPKLPVDVVISALKNDKEIISRRHAEIITLDSGDCIINDLGALNGIFVNNVKVNSQKLCDGNIIQFGGVCNQAVGSLLDKSDVSLRYLFRSNILPSGVKKRTDSSVHNGGGKRAKVVDSLQNIVSPPLTNHKLTNTSGTGNESTVLLEKAKKEMEMEQANFVGQIERLKHEHHISETELRREIATMKAQSGVQIEAIEARDRALKSKNVHNKQLEEQLRSVQRSVAEIEQKLADQVQQNQVLRTQLESAYAKEKKSTSAQCMVSNSTLESSISCPLCDELLVEAVVLQCSHGYCRACIEQHWHATAGAAVQSRTDSSAHLSASACRCPRCNVSSNIRPTKTKHSLKSGHSAVYVRSDHLDALTWLLIEAGSTAAREKYERREAQHRKGLVSLGIDPDWVPSNDPRDESDTPPATAKQSRTPSSSAIAAAADNHPSAFCDYCGSTGHKEDECPHHRDDAADENSSSSNSEEEGEGEEEEEQSEGEEDM